MCYIFFKIFKNLGGASYNVILGVRILSTVGIEVEHSVTNLVAHWISLGQKRFGKSKGKKQSLCFGSQTEGLEAPNRSETTRNRKIRQFCNSLMIQKKI